LNHGQRLAKSEAAIGAIISGRPASINDMNLPGSEG
jgi:hypothetical protein